MKRLLKLFGICLIITILTTNIFAASIVQVQFVGAYDKVVKYTSSGNWYAGLYNTKVNGSTWLTYCMDPFSTASSSLTNAYHYNPADIVLGNGKLYANPIGVTPSITLQKYRMLGYLYDFGQSLTNKYDRANLNLTFWEISMDYNGMQNSLDLGMGNFHLTSGNSGNAEAWMDMAFNYRNNNAYLPSLYTPNPLSISQEFFAPMPVPEPSAIMLLGAGLLSFGAFSWFRRKRD